MNKSIKFLIYNLSKYFNKIYEIYFKKLDLNLVILYK